MLTWLFNPEVMALGLEAICLVSVLLFSFATGLKYQFSYDRLPAATRWSELESLVGTMEGQLELKREELRLIEQKLSERAEAEAEAGFWRAEVETAKAEYAALDGQRHEVEETHEALRQLLEQLTVSETQLRELESKAGVQARAEAESAEEKVKEAEKRSQQIDQEAEQLKASHAELEKSVAEAESRLAALKEEKGSLGVELERARERLAATTLEVDDRAREVDRLNGLKAAVETELKNLREAIDLIPAKRSEIEEIDQSLEERRTVRETLEQTVNQLQREESRLQARIARLEEEAGALDGSSQNKDGDRALADLTKPPACLATERLMSTSTPCRPQS